MLGINTSASSRLFLTCRGLALTALILCAGAAPVFADDSPQNNASGMTAYVGFATLSSEPYTFDRVVTFQAIDSAGNVLETRAEVLTFTNDTQAKSAFGSVVLEDLPEATVEVAAKTAWSLRERVAVDAGNNAIIDLRGGDLNNSSSVNILDYTTLKARWFTADPVADINGDGQTNLSDYSIMISNWFGKGD